MDNKRYKNYMQYYSHTSEARKLNQTSAPKRKIKKVRIKRKKMVLKYIKDSKINLSVYAVISILLVFSGIFGSVAFSAMISSGNANITNLNKELKKQKEEYQLLQAEMTKGYDLAQIEKIAVSKLDMERPKSHQIVHINVPKQSYIVQYKPEDGDSEDSGGIQGLVSLAKKVLRIE